MYNNVVAAPIWDIELTHIAPPYLHILLGVVKKHHDLLEQECHDLDKALAELLSKEDNPNIKNACPAFRKSVTQIKSLRRRIRLDQLKTLTVFPMLFGPITAGLDVVLKKHKIFTQAYHSRSFIGNHCHKYLTDPVIKELTDSIVLQASQLTQNANIHTAAERICRKFASLNSLFAEVHTRVSHKEPIEDEEAQKSITRFQTTSTSFVGSSLNREQYLNSIFSKPTVCHGFGGWGWPGTARRTGR